MRPDEKATSFARRWMIRPSGQSRVMAGVLSFATVWAIGWIDYVADYHLLFTVLYVLPIGLATIYVNRAYAIFLAINSVAVATGGDIMVGAPFPTFIRVWNDAIIFALFMIVIHLLDALRRTLIGQEATIQERTLALRQEMEERRRLEHETLDLLERERQTFGHELHDVVCQELTGIAIASHLLTKKLEGKNVGESASAREIAGLVDRALDKARSLARGFFTSGFDVMGMAETLRELAQNVETRTGVRCEVLWQEDVVIMNEEVVIHLFRIAQEAIQNAAKHAEASRIEVSLERLDHHVRLAIEDDGKGLAPPEKSSRGLGLRIMAYRAGLIGGELKIEKVTPHGTRVSCIIPVEKIAKEPTLTH